jgi:hypothetical protein
VPCKACGGPRSSKAGHLSRIFGASNRDVLELFLISRSPGVVVPSEGVIDWRLTCGTGLVPSRLSGEALLRWSGSRGLGGSGRVGVRHGEQIQCGLWVRWGAVIGGNIG